MHSPRFALNELKERRQTLDRLWREAMRCQDGVLSGHSPTDMTTRLYGLAYALCLYVLLYSFGIVTTLQDHIVLLFASPLLFVALRWYGRTYLPSVSWNDRIVQRLDEYSPVDDEWWVRLFVRARREPDLSLPEVDELLDFCRCERRRLKKLIEGQTVE